MAIVVAAWAIFALISGPLADRFGRKTGIMFSCVLFIAGSLVMACARTIAMLLIGRFLIGGGMGNPNLDSAHLLLLYARFCVQVLQSLLLQCI